MTGATTPCCPSCRSDEHVGEVNHPTGRWFCTACPIVFDGGGLEALAVADKAAQRRHPNAHPHEPTRLPTSTREVT